MHSDADFFWGNVPEYPELSGRVISLAIGLARMEALLSVAHQKMHGRPADFPEFPEQLRQQFPDAFRKEQRNIAEYGRDYSESRGEMPTVGESAQQALERISERQKGPKQGI
jgi:hypothetical protein